MATAEQVKTAAADTADREEAPAKINLALHVTGRRPDGYHLIDTLAVFAEFGDTISLALAKGSEVRVDVEGPFAGDLAGTPAADNLVMRAARAIATAGGAKARGARLTLAKRTPVAAGLGGGSADAAATLRLLDRAWHLGTGAGRLAEIGATLGADVPMCLAGEPLRAGGIGERIAVYPGMPQLALVLVHPGVAVSTATVFAARSGPFGAGLAPLPPRFADAADLATWLNATRNDLTAPAARIAPAAADGTAALSADGDCLFARISGSGATAFGLFPSFAAATRAEARIRRERPGWWTVATMTRPANPDRIGAS